MSAQRNAFIVVATAALGLGTWAAIRPPRVEGRTQEQAPAKREFEVHGRQYSFEPLRIEVSQNDLVKVTFHADDIAHSFTVDSYRISKRAGAGQSVVFEFRADQTGTFPFYCDLTQDDGCRKMRGELVVRGR
jgi:heme/copper-type cytochrome/quinol oxidase subunit 2